MKICLVGSSGGHLAHLCALESCWDGYERFWVTFKKEDAISRIGSEKTYWCFHPTNRNMPNLIRNALLAVRVLHKEKPDLIVSTGAGVAIPFFWIGKLMGCKSIFIEVYDRIDRPTLTGKLVYPVADVFIIQWEGLREAYPKAINLGTIF